MARIVVVGAGVGGLAAAARLAAAGHQVTVFEQADGVGGKLGRYERRTPAGFRFDTGPSLLTLPAGLRRPVRGDRRRWTRAGPGAARPGGPAPVRRRHRCWTRAPTRPSSPPGSARRSATGPAADWRRLWRRAARIWDASWRHVLRVPSTRRCDLARAGLAAAATWPPIAPGPDAARAGPPAPARPAAADAARPLRHLHRRRPAPGPGRAGRRPVRGADLRRLVPARRPGHARRRAARRAAWTLGVVVRTGTAVDPDRRRGRPGPRGTARRRRPPCPPTWWWPTPTPRTVYRDLLPQPAPAGRRSTDRSLAGFVLLLGVRGRTPGWPTTTCSSRADYDAEFDAVFGDPARRRPGRRRPDGLRHRGRRPGGPPGRARGVVRAGQRAPARHRPGASTGGARRWPTRTPTGSWTCWPSAGSTCATGCCSGRSARRPTWTTATGAPGRRDLRHRHGAGLLRPANRGPVRGLFLVGGSTHPGGGLPMVTLSAADRRRRRSAPPGSTGAGSGRARVNA